MKPPKPNHSHVTDPVVRQLLQQLAQIAGGQNPQGGLPPTMADRIEAGNRYKAMLEEWEAKERQRMEADRAHALEQERQSLAAQQQGYSQEMDKNRLLLEAELERRKLDQEDDRIELQKAEVVVRALEVAARNPQLQNLADVVSELSFRLLGGELVPALEDRGVEGKEVGGTEVEGKEEG